MIIDIKAKKSSEPKIQSYINKIHNYIKYRSKFLFQLKQMITVVGYILYSDTHIYYSNSNLFYAHNEKIVNFIYREREKERERGERRN